MKTFKPLLLVAAGMAITLLFSFKNDEQAREYATLKLYEASIKDAIVFTSSSEVKNFENTVRFSDKNLVEVLNNLAKEGWVIVSSDYSMGQAVNRVIYLERKK